MTDRPDESVDELLFAAELDPGCSAVGDIVDAYVDIELSGADPAATYPGWALHLRSCPGCQADYRGLLEAARLFGDDEHGHEEPAGDDA